METTIDPTVQPAPKDDTLTRLVELLVTALEPRITQMIEASMDAWLPSAVEQTKKDIFSDILESREFGEAVTDVVSEMDFSIEVSRYGRR